MKRLPLIAAAETDIKEIEKQWSTGLVTSGERYNKVVDIWSHTNDKVARAMMHRNWQRNGYRCQRQESRSGFVQFDFCYG